MVYCKILHAIRNSHVNTFQQCLTNVIDKTLEMDNIFGRLTDVSWTRPVVDMTDRLMLKCIRVIREFIYQLASSKKICPLFQVRVRVAILKILLSLKFVLHRIKTPHVKSAVS